MSARPDLNAIRARVAGPWVGPHMRRVQADTLALIAYALQLEQDAAALRALIVHSAEACTIKGCPHCRWLGWQLGKLEAESSQ